MSMHCHLATMRFKIATAMLIAVCAARLHAADPYQEGFEAGTLSLSTLEVDGGCYTKSVNGYDSLGFASTPTASGSKALRVELRGGDYGTCGDWSDGKTRTEIGHAIGLPLRFHSMGATKWYAFSFQLDKSFPLTSSALLLWQLVKKDGTGPELHIMTVKNSLKVKERWLSSGGELATNALTLATGQWYRVIIQHKRSTGSDGFTKMWVNANSESDKPIYTYNGPTAFGTDLPYVKQGLYTGDKTLTGTHIVYFDDVKVGDSTATFSIINGTASAATAAAPAAPLLSVK